MIITFIKIIKSLIDSQTPEPVDDIMVASSIFIYSIFIICGTELLVERLEKDKRSKSVLLS